MFKLLYTVVGKGLRVVYDVISQINPSDTLPLSDYTIAIIIMAIFMKLITVPLTLRSNRSMAKMRALGPKMQEIQDKYGNDAMTIARKQQELYKEADVSPLGGMWPMLIQLPLVMAMHRIVQMPETYIFTEPGMYDMINKSFFWMTNIAEPDKTMILPIISAGISFLYQRMMSSQQQATGTKEQQEAMEASQRTMGIIMPLMTLLLYRNLPASTTLYITINLMMTAIQQIWVNRVIDKEN